MYWMVVSMTLGERLKAAREKKGWSQLYVAQKLGIANTVLSNYERDYRDPDTETLKRLAELYEVSTDYLLGIEVRESSGRAYYGGGKDLTDDERVAVEAFLEGYRRRKAEETKRSK